MELHWDQLYSVLPIMGWGMLGTFCAAGVIILAVSLLNRIGRKSG